MMTEKFTDSEIKQIHNFTDSSIMYEVSKISTLFNIPELTEEELKQIKIPENIEVPMHVHCRCSLLEDKL
jgi:hypothetical protein